MASNKFLIGFTAVAILGAGAGAVVFATNKKNDTSDTNSLAQVTPTSSTSGTITPTSSGTVTEPTLTSSQFKNGTYSADGTYFSPGGQQSLSIKVTLTNDIVTDLTFTQKAADRESKEFQDLFASGIRSKVVGQKINSVNVSRVSGSSLTSQGFNAALAKVKTQAKV